ncbi:hypothetical protein [Actinoplanes sp. L3-i22]|uniref:hypothetical protein n=1 Tax=Actinoplanes sp. L3-i22 TaxID=2836373 RepID=UPI001C859C84|nr:hypothetical protein [Actinoplanes sp. L3-i22]
MLAACSAGPTRPTANTTVPAATQAATPAGSSAATPRATCAAPAPSGGAIQDAPAPDPRVWNFDAIPGACAEPITGELVPKWDLTRSYRKKRGRYVESFFYAGTAGPLKGRTINATVDVGVTDGLPHYVACAGGGTGVDRFQDAALRDFIVDCCRTVVPPAELAKFQEWFDTSFRKLGLSTYQYNGTGFGSQLELHDNWIKLEMVGHDPKNVPGPPPL